MEQYYYSNESHKKTRKFLPLTEVKEINGRGWSWKSKMGPTSHGCQGRSSSEIGSFESPTTTTGCSSRGGDGCGDFHRLSWTVSATVHMAFAVLLSGHHVPRAPPFLAVGPPAPPWLWVQGSTSPVPWLQHWYNSSKLYWSDIFNIYTWPLSTKSN